MRSELFGPEELHTSEDQVSGDGGRGREAEGVARWGEGGRWRGWQGGGETEWGDGWGIKERRGKKKERVTKEYT